MDAAIVSQITNVMEVSPILFGIGFAAAGFAAMWVAAGAVHFLIDFIRYG